jgi:hypothetical protein
MFHCYNGPAINEYLILTLFMDQPNITRNPIGEDIIDKRHDNINVSINVFLVALEIRMDTT